MAVDLSSLVEAPPAGSGPDPEPAPAPGGQVSVDLASLVEGPPVDKGQERAQELQKMTAGMNPLESWAVQTALGKGGRLGDLAINTVLPLSGYIGGGVIGAAAATPETAGVGTVPGAVIGGRVGGATMGAAADALTQARQYFRGERDSWSPGSTIMSGAIGAFIPKAVAPAETVAGTIAKTITTRASQGAVLSATHTTLSGLIDDGKLNLGDILKSGSWGALVGGATGGVEGGGKAAFGLLQDINGKTPAEAAKIISVSDADPATKTAIQQRIEEMVGYKEAQGPAKVEGIADWPTVHEDSPAAQAAAAGNKVADTDQAIQEAIDTEPGLTRYPYPNGAPGAALRLSGEHAPAVHSAAESAKTFDGFMDDQEENLRAMKDQIDALDQHQRTVWEPEALPNMSSQARKIYDQYGFITPKVAATIAGGGLGAAYGGAQPGTPEEKTKLAITYGALGSLIGYGGGTSIEKMIESGGLRTLDALTDTAVLKSLWQRVGINSALTYTRDAADTKSMIAGNAAGKEVSQAIARLVPKKENDLARDALTFVVESQHSAGALDDFATKVAGSTQALPLWRMRAMSAIQYAKDNFETLDQVAQQYEGMSRAQVMRENAQGMDTQIRNGYVLHAQDLDTASVDPLGEAKGDGAASNFLHKRVYDTYADSIAAGIDPKSLDAADLMQSRITNGEKLINRRQWIESMRDYNDPYTGKPIVVPTTVETRADGSVYHQAPRGYTVQTMGVQSFALADGFNDVFNQLNSPSAWSKSAVGRAAMEINGVGKAFRLLLDTYHLGRIAVMEGAARGFNAVSAVARGKLPDEAFKTGTLQTLDNTTAEIGRISAQEKWTPAQLDQVLQDKDDLNKMVDAGLNVGGVQDALHEEFVRELPVIGDFNKWLFTNFQRRAIADVSLMELHRRQQIYGESFTPDMYRETAKDVNGWFRNLGRQGVFRSSTARDNARFLMLAPQWNEGGIRQEIGSVVQGAQAGANFLTGKTYATGLLAGATGTLIGAQFLANQVINMYTRGHPTWENPEEGANAKLSAWVPDLIGRASGKEGPGFFLSPLGIGAEITHLLMSRYEKTADFAQTLNEFGQGRVSEAMAPVKTFVLRKDGLGRPISPGDMWKEVGLSAIPFPIPTAATAGTINSIISQKPQQAFPGQFQKQLMSSVGLRTDQAPAPGQRIYQLAKEFNESHGVKPEAQFFGGDYTDLRQAVRTGNEPAADEAMDDLLKKKTPTAIDNYFRRLTHTPFTQNRRREAQFIQTLSPEQAGAYRQAMQDRGQEAAQARQLLRARLAAQQPAQSP